MNTQSRTVNSARNIVMGLVSKLVAILLTFISRKVFLHFLSLAYLGINGLFTDILSMLALADLGFATAMAFSYYEPLTNGNQQKLVALTNFYKKAYNLIALVVAVIGVALTPFLHYIINLPENIPYVEVYYLISLTNTVVSYLFVYKSSIITADQKGYLVSQYSVWIGIARSVVQIAVLFFTQSYLIYCIITIFSTLAQNLLISRQADKLYPFLRQKAQLAKEEKKSIFANLKSVFLYKVSVVAITGTDNVLISTLVNTMVVGQYSNYNTTVSNLVQLCTILFTSLTPSVGNLVAKEDAKKQLHVFNIMQTVSFWLISFFTFCLFFLMDDFIVLWLGPQYVFGGYTKIAILLNFYFSQNSFPVLIYREATGLYRKTKYIMLITAAINIGLSILLGRSFGITGILLATVIARLSTYLWYEPLLLFKDYFHTKIGSFFVGHAVNFVLLCACIGLFTLVPQITVTSWFSWIIKGAICAIAINIVYFLRFFRTPEFKFIKDKVLRMLFRRQKA